MTAMEWIPAGTHAGAFALGVGGSLVDPRAVAAGELSMIEQLAKQFVEIVRQGRAL